MEFARRLAGSPSDRRLKLFVTWQMLEFRRRNAELFRAGRYVPLFAYGPRAEHVCAFAWHSSGNRDCRDDSETQPANKIAIAIAPRLIAKLALAQSDETKQSAPPVGDSVWLNTALPLGDFADVNLKNLFTGEVFNSAGSALPLSAALANFPVALLTNLD